MIRLVAIGTVLYWVVFWTLNGLDKFLHGRDLAAFRWQGKNRTDQFSGYFEKIEIDTSAIESVLLVAGIWEIALGALFVNALYRLIQLYPPLSVLKAMSLGTAASIFTFIGFSAFDVVSGDRAELLEHGVYMMLLMVSWLTVGISQQRPSEPT